MVCDSSNTNKLAVGFFSNWSFEEGVVAGYLLRWLETYARCADASKAPCCGETEAAWTEGEDVLHSSPHTKVAIHSHI